MKFIALGYHDVADRTRPDESDGLRSSPSQYTLEPLAFRSHLQSILERAPASVAGVGQGQYPSKRPVFLTFDDGASGSYDWVAPELEQLKWVGHFFIVSNWIGKPGFMTAAQIRDLRRRGHIIGSHSRSHPERMSRLESGELQREWIESASVLEDVLGERVTVGSVPNGFYSRRVGEAARLAGIKVLFNSEPTMSQTSLGDLTVLGRYAIFSRTAPETAGLLAAGSMRLRWQQSVTWQLKKAGKALGGETYLKLRRQVLSRLRPN